MAQQTLAFYDETRDEAAVPKVRHPSELIKFLQGRNGVDDHRNEDRLVVQETKHGTILAAVDGITPLTKWTCFDDTLVENITTGRLAAMIAAKHIRNLHPGVTYQTLLAGIVREWVNTRRELDIPEHEILGAVFCIYVPWDGFYGSFWQLGDCGWGYAARAEGTDTWTDSLKGKMAGNSVDSDNRAEFIVSRLKEMGHDDYRGLPPAVLGELADTGWTHMCEQRKRTSNYEWLRSAERMLKERAVEPYKLPYKPQRIVVVTDGWNFIPPTLQEGLRVQEYLRTADRLMIGINRYKMQTAKGFVAFDGTVYPFTDDMGLIEAHYA